MTSPRDRHENKSSNLILYGFGIGAGIFVLIVIAIQFLSTFDVSIGGSKMALAVLFVGSILAGFGASYWKFIQPVSFMCPHCHRHQSNTQEPWVCRCGEAYSRSEQEPKSFINTVCRRCGRLPQTLHCPLCERGIPLGDLNAEDPRLWIKLAAFEYQADLPEPSPTEQYQKELDELRHKENVHQQMLRAIQAENDVDEFKKGRAERNQTPKEKIRASFDALLATKISIHEVANEMAKAVKENIDDPKKRELMLRNIEAIRDQMEGDGAYELEY